MSNSYPSLAPSGIGEAAKYNFNPWYIKLRFQDKSLLEGRYWHVATKPLSPIQSKIGDDFEEHIYTKLENYVSEHFNSWFDWDDKRNEEQLIEYIKKQEKESVDSEPILLTQVRFKDKIGEFSVVGDADLILLYSTEKGVHIYISDIKSSWEEKPHQQLQAAAYSILLKKILQKYNINYTISGGIIFREKDFDNLLQENTVPTFDLDSREGDVKRLLSDSGPFSYAFTNSFDKLPLQIFENNPYAEVSIVQAIENNDLSFIGLTQSEKSLLKSYNINTYKKLADLYEPITDVGTNSSDYKIKKEYKDIVEEIEEENVLSKDLIELSQHAQTIISELYDDVDIFDKPWLNWKVNTNCVNLPSDNEYSSTIPKDSLIRIYLNVQYDYITNSITTISGRVNCKKYDNEPLQFSRSINNIIDPVKNIDYNEERQLLKTVYDDIMNILEIITHNIDKNANQYIHFYVYGEDEKEMLYESITRHSDNKKIQSLKWLFDKREPINQGMISCIEPEIKNSFILKHMDTHISEIVKNFYSNKDSVQFKNEDYIVKYEDKNINLKDIFEQGLFKNAYPIQVNDSGITINNKLNNNSVDTTNFYTITPNSGAQIPLEYTWASKEIDLLDTSWANEKRVKNIIKNYMWGDKDKQQLRISLDLIKLLSSKFCHMLENIEQSILYKDNSYNKEKINLAQLKEKKPDEKELSESCKEYLDLETNTQEKEAFKIYQTPIKKRIIDGESAPIQITDVIEDKGYMFRLKGKLIFDEFDFDNPLRVAQSSKLKGSDNTTGGSRCVMTELISDGDSLQPKHSNPNKIANSPKVSIEEYNPEKNTIIIDGYRTSKHSDFEYIRKRIPWTVDKSKDYGKYIGPPNKYILDPNPDNMMAEKSLKSLRQTQHNSIYNDIKEIKNNTYQETDSPFILENIQEYITFYKDELEYLPNEKQMDFINIINRYGLLQGPPGTGKTSGALAHTVLSRAFDYNIQEKNLTGLVTGLSNKSVDEAMMDISELLNIYNSNFDEHPLQNVKLIRLSYTKPETKFNNIEYLNYQNEQDRDKLRNLLMPFNNTVQTTINSITDTAEQHTIIFATPGRIDGLVGKLFDVKTSEEAYKQAYEFFDLLAIDEASMMPLHQLFMTSAFMKEQYQVLLAGDQRQLSPVQSYDWKNEQKTSITNHFPYLSSLDYFRLLRGDSVTVANKKHEIENTTNIPLVKLDKTYRCHELVTEFLYESVYKQDDITYTSNQTVTIPEVPIEPNSIEQALQSECPLTLILHDDTTSKQVNYIESTIIQKLESKVPKSESIGIVTPHNAQKGELSNKCMNSSVDTVERFQGGEKDVMFLSTTVSDPVYLSAEEDFILSKNRLNVALSRMKKKLIILAPKSIFQIVPNDIETYDESTIWKLLYEKTVNNLESDWEGNIQDINNSLPNTNIEIYNITNFK